MLAVLLGQELEIHMVERFRLATLAHNELVPIISRVCSSS